MTTERSLKSLIRYTWSRRDQWTADNRDYFDRMILYLRASDVPQHQVEELLIEWQDHLIQAQREGKSAEDVFGPDPEGYCQEILEQLPKTTRLHALKEFGLVCWYTLVWMLATHAVVGLVLPLVPLVTHADRLHEISVLFLGGIGVVAFLLVKAFFWWVRRDAFTKSPWRGGVMFGVIVLGFQFMIGLLVWAEQTWGESMPTVSFHPWLSLGLFAVLVLIDRFYIRNSR
jgi:uncharacterized membrane-anchored protein